MKAGTMTPKKMFQESGYIPSESIGRLDEHYVGDKASTFRAHPLRRGVALLLAVIFAFIGISGLSSATQKAHAFDVTKWVACSWGDDSVMAKAYEYSTTDELNFMLRSKSTINFGISDVDKGFNLILGIFSPDYNEVNSRILGLDVEDKNADTATSESKKNFNSGAKVNPFDRFGMAGLNFTSYTGEWKYVKVQVCSDKPEPIDPLAGSYYKDRQEPQSVFSDVPLSKDIRSIQFNKGFLGQYTISLSNMAANILFLITKTIVTATVTMINFAWTDIAETTGLNNLIFGGENSGEGIFQYIFDNLFLPMSVIAFSVTGIWLMWAFFSKKGNNKPFRGLARSIFMFVLAVIVAFLPNSFLALPNTIAIFGQTMIVQAVNSQLMGEDAICSTDIGSKEATTIFQEGDQDKSALTKSSENVRSAVGCTFWATFIVKPWSQGQFGKDWNEVWAKGKIPDWAPEGAKEIGNDKNEKIVGDAGVPVGDGSFINNWALFQISAQTNVHSPYGEDGSKSKTTNGISNDWWRIVDATSNYFAVETKHDIQVSGSSNESSSSSSSEEAEAADNGEWVKPAEGSVVSPFGWRSLGGVPDLHTGTDFNAACNTDVLAAGGGVVKFVGKEALGGNAILIQHSSGIDSLYVHMADGTNTVREGQTVKAGQKISEIGNSGKSYGCHLHFEIRDGGNGVWSAFNKAIDPQEFLTKKGVDLKTTSISRVDGDGSSSSSKSNSTSSFVEVEIDGSQKPTESWDIWAGNSPWTRAGTAATSIIVATVGLLPIFIPAWYSAIYGLLTSLLMAFLPFAFLMGVGQGRFFDMFLQYLDLLIKTVLKRWVMAIVLGLSIVFSTIAMDRMSELGWWQGILLLVAFMVILFALRKRLVEAVDMFRLASGQMNAGISTIANRVTGGAKSASNIALAGAVGGATSKKYGGSFTKGLGVGLKNQVKTEAYKSNAGREINTAMETFNARRGNITKSMEYCATCGKPLNDGSGMVLTYVDSSNNYHCETCYHTRRIADPKVTSTTVNYGPSKDTASKVPLKSNADWDGNPKEKKKRESLKSRILTSKDENGADLSTNDIEESLKNLSSSVTKMDLAQIRSMILKGEEGAMHPPKDIRKYLDEPLIEKAKKDGDLAYIQTVYNLAWAKWYEDSTGRKLSESREEFINDVNSR